jgi:hypothetical protein
VQQKHNVGQHTDGRLYQNVPDYRKTNNFNYEDKKNILKIWKFYLPKQKIVTSVVGKSAMKSSSCIQA